MRIVARMLIAVLVVAVVAALAYRALAPTAAPAPASGIDALFAATFPDQHGSAQALAQWRGKIVVVNFWATWCPPCREEMPELSALQDKYRSRDVVVLGIATDDVAKIRDFAKSSPLSYPLLSGDFEAMALAESLGNNKGILPYTVLLRRDGSLAAAYLGRVDMQILERDVLAAGKVQ